MNKPILDFQIIYNTDPRVLLVMDNSLWKHIENKPSIIEITVPGATDPMVFFYKKNTVNSYNSTNLNISCPPDCDCEEATYVDLPDGIYKITIKGSPDKFNSSKVYLRTTKTRLELDKLYLQIDLLHNNPNTSKVQMIREVNFLLDAAEANVRLGYNSDALELFNKAVKQLERCK